MFTRKTFMRLLVVGLLLAGGIFLAGRLLQQPAPPEPYSPSTAQEKQIDAFFNRIAAVEEKFWAHKETGLTTAEDVEFTSIIAEIDKFDWAGLGESLAQARADEAKYATENDKESKAAIAGKAKVSKTAGDTIANLYEKLFLEQDVAQAYNRFDLARQRVEFIASGFELPFGSRYDYAKALLASKKPDKARQVLFEILSKEPRQAGLEMMGFLAGMSGAYDDATFMKTFRTGGGDVDYLKDIHDHRASINLLTPFSPNAQEPPSGK
jgi:hypothetical protein